MDTHADCSSETPPRVAQAVRAFDTKTGACAAAVSLARALTGRSTVIVVPSPYTRANLTLLCKIMAEASDRIAALVVELDRGGDTIYGRFLKKARELASAEGAALIWCETIADPEVFHGGLQAVYRVRADLTCLTQPGDAHTSWLCADKEVLDEAPL
jgi:glutamate-1-semialdehyde aminotransferase